MPYSTPTSPMASPVKETAPKSKKGFYTPPTHVEDIVSGPMPGIPRRSSNSRTTSPAMSRSASSSHPPFSAPRPLDGLPRRSSHTPTPSAVSGLPDGGSLGLKLHPSPTRAPVMSRGPKDSMSSTSTIESSLPPTPKDEPLELYMNPSSGKGKGGIPFPPFEPIARPLSAKHPLRASVAPSRPGMPTRQHSAGGHVRGPGSLQINLPGSASTSHLVPSPVDTRPSRPSAMIRKKSGEVVKPSLKQRSMSTPDLTRQVETSPTLSESRPFGEERSKSVRFADSDDTPGSKLDNVVLFLQNSKPAAVSKAADPDNHLTETETEADTDASDFVQFRTKKNAAARALDDARDIQLEGGSRVPRVRCDFAPDARNALVGEHVVLERAELKTVNGSLCLQGTTIVRNVAFQKWVAIRFTLDHWQTVSEVSGTHVTHVPSATSGDEGWDRFSFTIKLEDFRRKLDERQLMLCIRFSVDGREWWDSNNGLNYNFNFKRSSPKRNRHSLPAAFNRFDNQSASMPSLPGLRQNTKGNFAPSSRIAQQFGADKSAPSGPRDWTFPPLAKHVVGGPSASGADSPQLSPPPVTAFRPPGPPDVHTHLHLTSYCAPSPPTSPPKEDGFSFSPPAMTLSPDGLTHEDRSVSLNIVGGQPATLSAPLSSHERRSSWNGKTGSWDSFAKVMDDLDTSASTDGSSTPVATGSRSPLVGVRDSEDANSPSPISRPLTMKRSTGNLQALRSGEGGLMTPPSSHSSSPSPVIAPLPLVSMPEAMSPSLASSSTTGDSSPVDTVGSDSTPDLANLHIDIDPSRSNASHRLLNNASYQEFLDKFCFFQSPRATPNPEDLPVKRKNYVHVSGHSSPNGFPFYASHSSHSPHDTPTPRKEYDSAQDAFRFYQPPKTESGQQTPATTPRPTPGHSVSHSRSDIPPPTNATAWASGQLHNSSPSLTAK